MSTTQQYTFNIASACVLYTHTPLLNIGICPFQIYAPHFPVFTYSTFAYMYTIICLNPHRSVVLLFKVSMSISR